MGRKTTKADLNVVREENKHENLEKAGSTGDSTENDNNSEILDDEEDEVFKEATEEMEVSLFELINETFKMDDEDFDL